MTHMYFLARTEGRISYGHLGRTNSCFNCISFAIRLSGRKVAIKLIDWWSCWHRGYWMPGAQIQGLTARRCTVIINRLIIACICAPELNVYARHRVKPFRCEWLCLPCGFVCAWTYNLLVQVCCSNVQWTTVFLAHCLSTVIPISLTVVNQCTMSAYTCNCTSCLR